MSSSSYNDTVKFSLLAFSILYSIAHFTVDAFYKYCGVDLYKCNHRKTSNVRLKYVKIQCSISG